MMKKFGGFYKSIFDRLLGCYKKEIEDYRDDDFLIVSTYFDSGHPKNPIFGLKNIKAIKDYGIVLNNLDLVPFEHISGIKITGYYGDCRMCEGYGKLFIYRGEAAIAKPLEDTHYTGSVCEETCPICCVAGFIGKRFDWI